MPSFGENIVRLSPSECSVVQHIKSLFASIIDHLDQTRNSIDANGETKRLCAIGITDSH